jgi:hypothetical protein
MAYAALQLVARRYNRATMWEQLAAAIAAGAPAPGEQQQQVATVKRRRGGWLDR